MWEGCVVDLDGMGNRVECGVGTTIRCGMGTIIGDGA